MSYMSGYDIGPDDDRFTPSGGTAVEMISISENPSDDTVDVMYQQVYVARPQNGIYVEPLDESTGTGASRPIIRATDSKYYSEANRLQTCMYSWLDDYHVTPEDLARDGFIHIGPGDKVKCVFCMKTLGNWEPNDSVEREHRRHCLHCPFVNGKCDQLNVPINPMENMKRSFGLKMTSSDQYASSSVVSMQDFSDRMKSYDTWPKCAHIRSDALAEAGFYYCGTGDEVKCYSCAQILAQWEPGDDPWFEHAKVSPCCAHVQSVKGSDFVQQVQERLMHDKGGAAQFSEEHNFAAADLNKEEQHTNRSPHKSQQLAYPVQVLSAQIAEDLKSAPVKAILQIYDVPIEKMRQKLENIRITKGTAYKVTRKDLDDLEDLQ